MNARHPPSVQWPVTTLLIFSLFIIQVRAGGNMPVPVHVVPARQIELAPTRWMPGTVIGRFDSRVAAEVEGRIESLVDIGDQVTKGMVITRIDDTTFRIQVEEARAQIMPIEARLAFYNRETERLEKLADQNVAARNQLDEMISNRDQARGDLQIRRAQLQNARDKLKRTEIHAPFDGVITQRYKMEGEWVTAGEEIVRLVNTNRLEIQVRVPVESARLISQGDTLQVRDSEKEIDARVITMVPVGDELSRLYEVRLALDESDWLTGHAVRVSIPTGEPRQVVAVPRDALVIRSDDITVFRILGDETAEAVSVTTGIAKDHLIEVRGDINPGDRVVIRGNERLRPEQKVSIQQGSSDP